VHRAAQHHALDGLPRLGLDPLAERPQIEGDQVLQLVIPVKDRRPLVGRGQAALERAQQAPWLQLVDQRIDVPHIGCRPDGVALDRAHVADRQLDLAHVAASHPAGATDVLPVIDVDRLLPDVRLVLAGDIHGRADHGRVAVVRVEGKGVHPLPVERGGARVGGAKVQSDTHHLLNMTDRAIHVTGRGQTLISASPA